MQSPFSRPIAAATISPAGTARKTDHPFDIKAAVMPRI
jgi:hypothetical protein